MPVVAELKGLQETLNKFKALTKRATESGRNPTAVVGYTASYALLVHENRERVYRVGRPGFLLDVARELRSVLIDMIREGAKSGLTLGQAILRAALFLQRESQNNCPVRTGNLRNSAFTRLEGE